MTAKTREILEIALALPESERIELTEQLLETLPPGDDDCTDEEFLAELERRAAEYEQDPSIGIALEEVLKDE